jgi:hypothetical protein
MTHRHFLIVAALGAGEVAGAAGRVRGDDSSLVVIVDVSALLALLAVSNDRAPLVHDDPSLDLYWQQVTLSGASYVYSDPILPEIRR